MNAAKAREIPIKKVLQNLGCEPTRTNEKESWYLSPLRIEKSASFKVNNTMNRWFDHGEQKGGNVIDFVVLKFGFTISEALEYLTKFEDFFSFQKQIFETPQVEKIDPIKKIIPVQHIALIQYLKSRGITKYQNLTNLKEVHYEIYQNKYFAIGFRNNSDGWELRSKYSKSCIIKKDITLIENESRCLKIFEGFFDYLSLLQISDEKNLNESDYLILNSAALIITNISILEKYATIELYLDNDATGEKYTQLITEQYPQAKDERRKYSKYKDLNEYLCSCKLT